MTRVKSHVICVQNANGVYIRGVPLYVIICTVSVLHNECVLYCVTVGEPLNKEAWKWYNTVVGEEKCTIVDTYWQTGRPAY